MSPEINQFIEDYSEELVSANAAYFIGAGISVNSRLPDWKGLLKPFAGRIGIKDLDGKDMPLMAQYVINEATGNRGPLVNAISRKLRRSFPPNEYHESISRTYLKTIWTTNYDNLLEKIFANTIIDVKFNDEAIARDVSDTQVEIIKMHGCIFNSHINDIVITQADYEDFFFKRPATSQRLKVDLLQKSFLFIGYGYGDPNIQYVISEARRLAGNNTRQHYLITKDEKDNREFELWCSNLNRYGIKVIRIGQHKDLHPILEKLSLKSRGKSIFVTGSHDKNTDEEAINLAKALANEEGIKLNDGQSTGIMRVVSTTYLETIISNQADITKRLQFFPNPYAANPKFANDSSLLPTLKKWRIPLFKSTYIMVAFDGGMGTTAEVQIALEMGCIVIPFFKDKDAETWSLLENPLITDQISKFDNEYLNKVREFKVTYQDVLLMIKLIFK